VPQIFSYPQVDRPIIPSLGEADTWACATDVRFAPEGGHRAASKNPRAPARAPASFMPDIVFWAFPVLGALPGLAQAQVVARWLPRGYLRWLAMVMR